MRVLVACEFSGAVRRAFRDRGHAAWSCDILDAEDGSEYHHKGDAIKEAETYPWDLMIAHPPCTYLCNSGVRWLNGNVDRQVRMQVATEFFFKLLKMDIAKICIENPIPHCHARLPKYTQIIQPWQYGHGETKATCLWLKNLPPLRPTNIVNGREAKVHKMPPSLTRSKERSRTYTGIAEAFAEQWGSL